MKYPMYTVCESYIGSLPYYRQNFTSKKAAREHASALAKQARKAGYIVHGSAQWGYKARYPNQSLYYWKIDTRITHFDTKESRDIEMEGD